MGRRERARRSRSRGRRRERGRSRGRRRGSSVGSSVGSQGGGGGPRRCGSPCAAERLRWTQAQAHAQYVVSTQQALLGAAAAQQPRALDPRLHPLLGRWMGRDGTRYQLTEDTPSSLTVTTVRPDGQRRTTRGLISNTGRRPGHELSEVRAGFLAWRGPPLPPPARYARHGRDVGEAGPAPTRQVPADLRILMCTSSLSVFWHQRGHRRHGALGPEGSVLPGGVWAAAERGVVRGTPAPDERDAYQARCLRLGA
ncbi:unnamed protein product [Prorocentrum cordatum]|uniref:Uncharacterized protein n=1 Tax=Prorocentrum cordatum TaxID=2364126 RepID=A0ABN9UZN9_9DINO|nr:unnamed protein product [Polarella glacialis]